MWKKKKKYMEGCAQVTCTHYAIVSKRLEPPWILVSKGVLEPIPRRLRNDSIYILYVYKQIVTFLLKVPK